MLPEAHALLSVLSGFQPDREISVQMLLQDIPAQGGHVTREILVLLVRESYDAGVIEALTRGGSLQN